MRAKHFFANATSKALALAAAVMMSLAFAACGSDNNDDGGGKTPEPTGTGTVTVDGVEKPIVKAKYTAGTGEYEGNYWLFLFLSADGKERVNIYLNKYLHMIGNPVDLTEKEGEHDEGEYWIINYYDADDELIIHTWADPHNSDPVFKTGTLAVSGSPKGTIDIKLKNGSVKGEDGKEHTFTISYSGKMR